MEALWRCLERTPTNANLRNSSAYLTIFSRLSPRPEMKMRSLGGREKRKRDGSGWRHRYVGHVLGFGWIVKPISYHKCIFNGHTSSTVKGRKRSQGTSQTNEKCPRRQRLIPKCLITKYNNHFIYIIISYDSYGILKFTLIRWLWWSHICFALWWCIWWRHGENEERKEK